MSGLPRLVALESGGEYFEYENRKGEYFHRAVRLTSKMVVGEGVFTKFEVVQSQRHRDMIHIRTCYNNKFLRRVDHGGANWFLAVADEPDEDRANWTCTLFRRVFDSNNRLGLFFQTENQEHAVAIGSHLLIFVWNSTIPFYLGVTDMQSLVKLPRHVSFIGDNDQFLSSRYIRLRNRLQFASGDRFDSTVHHEAITLNNGDVQLRSITFNQLWRKSANEWIWCDTNNTNDRDTRFRPVRLNNQGKTILLLNLGNNKNCMRWTRAGQPRLFNTLTASASNFDHQAVMTVVEAIRDREIYDIRYRLDESRIYNVTIVRTLPKTTDNFSYTETPTARLSYSLRRITRETFSSSHSWKLSYSVEITVSIIPRLVEGVVQYQGGYEGNVNWSEEHEFIEDLNPSVDVPVPPRTRVNVRMVYSTGNIDVPYSYKQRDLLMDINAPPLIQNFEDGLFTGFNTDVFHFEIREESLPGNDDPNSDREGNTTIVRSYIIRPERPHNNVITSIPLPSKQVEEKSQEIARDEEELAVLPASKL